MRKPNKKNIGSNTPATKGDLERLREDVHADMVNHMVSKQEFQQGMSQMVTKKEFKQRMSLVATKKDLEKFATKEDLKKFPTEDDPKGFATKKDIEGLGDHVINEVMNQMKAYHELRDAERDALHQDELDIVAGKKDTPPQWKSMPRRLKTVEMEVEKIKDRLTL